MKKLTTLTMLLLIAITGCNGIDQNQQEFNAWIKTAKKPVITRNLTHRTGLAESDDFILTDADNETLILHNCTIALPDTIK